MQSNFKTELTHYETLGYAIVEVFSPAQVELIREFAENWIFTLLGLPLQGSRESLPLCNYHRWYKDQSIPHREMFAATNRHQTLMGPIRDTLLNSRVDSFVRSLIGPYELWNEGLGNVAFRFVRPGFGDGYPMSRKEWGPAKRVVSCWVPVCGYSENETLQIVPGSHLQDYEKYLPENSQFCCDEYRLVGSPEDLAAIRPTLKPGEVIFFHPRLLHSEDVTASHVTRLNLELRFMPLS